MNLQIWSCKPVCFFIPSNSCCSVAQWKYSQVSDAFVAEMAETWGQGPDLRLLLQWRPSLRQVQGLRQAERVQPSVTERLWQGVYSLSPCCLCYLENCCTLSVLLAPLELCREETIAVGLNVTFSKDSWYTVYCILSFLLYIFLSILISLGSM